MTDDSLDAIVFPASMGKYKRHAGCDCDFCSGKKDWNDNWCARCGNNKLEPPKWWENCDVCNQCEVQVRVEESHGNFALDHTDGHDAPVPDLHATCSAQLHCALLVVSELLGCIDEKAHAWEHQQRAVRAAKLLLREHGYEVTK